MAGRVGRQLLALGLMVVAILAAAVIVLAPSMPRGLGAAVTAIALGGVIGTLPVLVNEVRRWRLRRRYPDKRGTADSPRRRFLVPGSLPPPPVLYVGRRSLVAEVIELLKRTESPLRWRFRPHVIVVHGEAGIGKSAFAIRVATPVADDFDGGVVYASLTGVTGGDKERIANLVGDLLVAVQGPNDTVPTKLSRRRAALRRRTRRSGRVLFVLDDVADPVVLDALLPATSAAVVLVTTRDPALRVRGALVDRRPMPPLSAEEAEALMRDLLGDPVLSGSALVAFRTIVASAAYYPLALHLAARAISSRGVWAIEDVVQALPKRQGEPSVDAARQRMLDLSAALLDPIQLRALLSLSLLSAPTFVPWMVQALADIDDDDDAWIVCERLADQRLVQRISADITGVVRMRVPDRVNEYIRERARNLPGADAALSRLAAATRARENKNLEPLLAYEIDQFLLAGKVSKALDEARGALAAVRERTGPTSRDQLPPVDERRALAILADVLAELGGLDDAVDLVDRRPDPLAGRARPDEPEDHASARAGRVLGRLRRRQLRFQDAVDEVKRSLQIATNIRDRSEQVLALRELAIAYSMWPDADGEHSRSAEAAVTQAKTLLGERRAAAALRCRLQETAAIVLLNQATYHRAGLPALDAAADHLNSAVDGLDELDGLDNRHQLWRAWFTYHQARVDQAYAEHLTAPAEQVARRRRLDSARELAQQALDSFSTMSHKYGSARCRLVIGETFVDERPEAALPMLEEALETFTFCGDQAIEATTAVALADARLRDRSDGRPRITADDREVAIAELRYADDVFARLHDPSGRAKVTKVRADRGVETLGPVPADLGDRSEAQR